MFKEIHCMNNGCNKLGCACAYYHYYPREAGWALHGRPHSRRQTKYHRLLCMQSRDGFEHIFTKSVFYATVYEEIDAIS